MAEQFDAYHKWLGISPDKQPPNLYQLLAVDEFESDPDVIEAAADQRMSHLRRYQAGKHGKLSQKLLNEISAARVMLLNPEKKADYDEQLKQELGPETSEDPLGPSFDQLGGGTSLPGPAGFESQPAPSPAAPVISTKGPAKKKPAWVLPAGISVGALVILGVVIAIVIVAGSKKDEAEPAVAEQPGEEQPASSDAGETDETTRSDIQKNESTDNQSTGSDSVDSEEETNEKDDTSSPPETVDDSDTATETQTQDGPTESDTVTAADGSTKPVEFVAATKKHPLPTKAQQQPVWAALEETFKLSEERTNEESLELARELFKLAGQATNPVEKFVLLRTTMKYAGDGGDAQLLLQAVDETDRHFEIDRLEIAQQALIGFSGMASTEKHFGSLAEATKQFIADAVAQNRVDLAQRLAHEVYNATVKRANVASFRKQFYEQRKRIDELHSKWQQVQDALAKLDSNPDDPDANLIVGKWKCFREGDWESGLPLLAKSGDETLGALAQQELSLSGQSVDDQLTLGDAWWNAADKADAEYKSEILGRAYDWYTLAKPDVTASLDRLRIEKRLKEMKKWVPIAASRPPPTKTEFPRGEWVDVLVLVDPAKDSVAGQWARQPNGVTNVKTHDRARFMIPVSIDGSYEFEFEFTSEEGKFITAILPVADRYFALLLSHWDGEVSGIHYIDGKYAIENSSKQSADVIRAGVRYKVTVRVEAAGNQVRIATTLNDRPYVHWEGSLSSLSPPESHALPNEKAIGLSAAQRSHIVFHAARLRMLNGTATIIGEESNESTDNGPKVPVSPKGADGLPQLIALRRFANEGRTAVGFLQGGRFGLRVRQSTAYIVDLATGKDVTVMKSSGQYVTAAAITPDEKHVVVGYRRGGGPFVFNTSNGQVVGELVGHVQADFLIEQLDVSPDGKMVVSSGGDDTIRIWELQSGKELHKLDIPGTPVPRFLRDGSLVIGRGGALELWDPEAGKFEKKIADLGSKSRALAVSPTGDRFAAGLSDEEIKIFSFDKTWSLERAIKCPEWVGIAFSHDGRQILSAGRGSLALWDVETGEKLASAVHEDVVEVALSPDGKHALSSSKRAGGTILWRLP